MKQRKQISKWRCLLSIALPPCSSHRSVLSPWKAPDKKRPEAFPVVVKADAFNWLWSSCIPNWRLSDTLGRTRGVGSTQSPYLILLCGRAGVGVQGEGTEAAAGKADADHSSSGIIWSQVQIPPSPARPCVLSRLCTESSSVIRE